MGRVLNGVEVITPPLCDVPAGLFKMGSDPRRDKDWQPNERPQKEIPVAAFQIARYPVTVTVAEYACYVRATRREPRGWQDQLTRLDHPVVCMFWNDARAYLGWLTQETRQAWRLPTEAEWEKAARGTDGRIYPWGDAWDTTRANTYDGGLPTTTPVGSYPSGASPYGVQDMAGNVWEPTSSLYKPYPYKPAVSEDLENRTGDRVLRGGASNDGRPFMRAANRWGNSWGSGSSPDGWSDSFGLRVVRGVGAGTP